MVFAQLTIACCMQAVELDWPTVNICLGNFTNVCSALFISGLFISLSHDLSYLLFFARFSAKGV